MFITLSQLQSRIETVRRNIGDSSRTALIRMNINGQWIEINHETFVVDDSGAFVIEAQINERVVDCAVENSDAADDPALYPSSPPIPWRAAFERLRKNQYTDHRQVTMFNFSREKMNDAMEVAAAADEAVELGSRWEALTAAQSQLIEKLQLEIDRLKQREDVRVIGSLI